MLGQRFVAIGVVLAAVLAAALCEAGGPAIAPSNQCTNVGTWQGLGDTGFTWLNTITPGTNATAGQMNLEWVVVDPTLFGFFPTAVRVTNAIGVWEKVNHRSYLVTWVAWGLDASGAPVYVGRLSGSDSMEDCDHLEVSYVLEVFLPDQDMATDPPIFCANGQAVETRMPLVQATCE